MHGRCLVGVSGRGRGEVGGARTYARGRGCLVGGYVRYLLLLPQARGICDGGAWIACVTILFFLVRGRFGYRASLESYYGIFQAGCHSYCSSLCMLLHTRVVLLVVLEVLCLSQSTPSISTARKGNSLGSYLPHLNIDEAANGIVRGVPYFLVCSQAQGRR